MSDFPGILKKLTSILSFVKPKEEKNIAKYLAGGNFLLQKGFSKDVHMKQPRDALLVHISKTYR